MPNAASTPYFFFLNLLLGVLVSQCSWNPLSTEVVGTGVSGELEHGSLGIWAAGYNLKRRDKLVRAELSILVKKVAFLRTFNDGDLGN